MEFRVDPLDQTGQGPVNLLGEDVDDRLSAVGSGVTEGFALHILVGADDLSNIERTRAVAGLQPSLEVVGTKPSPKQRSRADGDDCCTHPSHCDVSFRKNNEKTADGPPTHSRTL